MTDRLNDWANILLAHAAASGTADAWTVETLLFIAGIAEWLNKINAATGAPTDTWRANQKTARTTMDPHAEVWTDTWADKETSLRWEVDHYLKEAQEDHHASTYHNLSYAVVAAQQAGIDVSDASAQLWVLKNTIN